MHVRLSQRNTKPLQNDTKLSLQDDSFNSIEFQKICSKSDFEIWELFKKGDESAFVYIYSQYFGQLGIYGEQLSQNILLIEDAIQDVFIDLRKKRNKLPAINHSIKSYLYKCLRNKILEYKRKENNRIDKLEEYSRDFNLVAPIEEKIIQEQRLIDSKKAIIEAINKLTSRQREVIHYMYYENLSYEEIKEIMSLDNVKSARNLVYKALNKLKLVLKLAFLLLFSAFI